MVSLKDKVEEMEREEIIRALKETGWIKAKAARVLGITERMIGYKIKKYGIKISMTGEESEFLDKQDL
ncbi:MAG: helix-turn-helix domain-containing protein [Nitrospirota bacterium]|nr:helix-turn-helix domain-containing protein [Nitrospirota bacterium]